MIEKINEEIKKSLKDKNINRKNTFKSIKAKALSISKDKKISINDQIVVKAINKELKELKQTRESYFKIDNLTEEQSNYLFYIESIIEELENNWIPKINKTELKDKINAILINSPPGLSFGLKMKIVMKELHNEFDGKIVSEVIKELG